MSLPAVGFAHSWLSGAGNYADTLQHLASWGIVAAAPDTERGPMPSHVGLATDLLTVLDVCTGVRLGGGDISVHPNRVAVAGDGMGAGVAVLAAAKNSDIAAVGALFPAVVSPSAEAVAPRVSAPGLVLTGSTVDKSAKALAAAWGGDCALRTVGAADADGGLAEGRRLMKVLGVSAANRKAQVLSRALLTGFLLYVLTEDKKYKAFADDDLPKAALADPLAEEPPKKTSPVGQISQLLRR